MQVRTAVLPAAGLGTRFLPASKAVPKPLATVVDRPAVQWVVEEAARAGLERVVVVVGRGQGSIGDHFDRHLELEAALERAGKTALLEQVRQLSDLAEVILVRQGEPRGLGHAVACARSVVGDEAFAVLLPDDLMHPSSTLLADMVTTASARACSVVALMAVGRDAISAYGCAAVDGDRIVDVVEKPAPDEAPSDLAITGRYVFTPAVFEALDRVGEGALGELQLTDAIRILAHEGEVVAHRFDTGRFDVGNQLDYLTSTVELALDHPRLGQPFAERLRRIVGERGLDRP